MTHKQLLIVALTFIHFTTVPMQMAVETQHDHWLTLPAEVFLQIIAININPTLYPWQKVKNARQLALVSPAWRSLLYKKDGLSFIFNIPQMHYAAMFNDVREIVTLKLNGHSPLAPDQRIFNPIDYAAACNQINALRALKIGNSLSLGEINYMKKCIVTITDETKAILTSKSSKKYSEKKLKTAIQKKDYTHVLKILSSGDISSFTIDIDKFNQDTDNEIFKLLEYFIQCEVESLFFSKLMKDKNPSSKDFEIFEKSRANPRAYNSAGFALIHFAAASDKLLPTLQKLLANNKTDINQQHLLKGYNTLQIAVLKNALLCTQYLITKKANDTHTCKKGNTAVHYAARADNLECLKQLLARDTNLINAKNRWGYTPIMMAMYKKHTSCVFFLIEKKADLNIQSNNGITVLHYAVGSSNPDLELVEHLLYNKANVNCANNKNYEKITKTISEGQYTPLHYAAQKGNSACVKLLLHFNADITLKTQTGNTALDLAREYNHEEVIPLLLP